MVSDEKQVSNERFVLITFHSDGDVTQEGNVNVFDMWGIARFIQHFPDLVIASNEWESVDKYIRVTINDDGMTFVCHGYTALDVFALSRYLEMYADEMYIAKKVADRTRQGATVKLVSGSSLSRSERRKIEREKAN